MRVAVDVAACCTLARFSAIIGTLILRIASATGRPYEAAAAASMLDE
jgi:hypothetical protein